MEYWVVEWVYTQKAIDKFMQTNPKIVIDAYSTKIWNNLNMTNHSFEFAMAVLRTKCEKGVLEDVYHWRIRELHSGDVIPGEIL